MATVNVPNDLIPAKAGVVRVTPYNKDGTKALDKAYTTKRNFLTSTQVTITRTSETLPNGNGADKDYPTDEKYNLAVITQTYDPKFHSIISGRSAVATVLPILYDTSVVVPAETYEVNLTDKPPVSAHGSEEPVIEVRDVYGNLLTKETSPAEGKYKYDPDTKKLTFDASAEGKTFSLVYYVDGSSGEAYESSDIITNPEFMIEVFAEVQSAETGAIENYYAKIEKAVVSGDLPHVMSQKSINNAITYNFSSAPVAKGVKPFYDSFTPAT